MASPITTGDNAGRESKRVRLEQAESGNDNEGVLLENLAEVDNYYDPSESSERARLENSNLIESFERQRRARTLAVPTDDTRVKMQLRELNQPICLFGEGPAERRDRLRDIMSRSADIPLDAEAMEDVEMREEEEAEEEQEEFYTEGSTALLAARQWIAKYSLPRARDRIAQLRQAYELPLRQLKTTRQDFYKKIQEYVNYSSQVGDDRTVAQCALSPDATAGWTGLCQLWQVPLCTSLQTYRGHTDRAVSVAFHPQATRQLGADSANLATGSADGTINLWSLERDRPLNTLRGHSHRVFDTTWRLWDVERGDELLLQEGHSHEVYAIDFQEDGALVATGGLDAMGRVWDLRTGRSVMVLEGHVKEVLGIAWSPNGHQIVTGSGDHSIKVFDVRKLQSIYTVAAHTSLVSDVKFYHSDQPYQSGGHSGLFLASSSYDGTVKLWSSGDWRLQKTLVGHEGRVTSVSIGQDTKFIASAGFDRTFKLWAHESTV
ncbi:WD40-repeat-containing domain protein [Syncephalis plumigaleata]|nr:WD40-repeat-containing domain protein [Syncephalis plumigaleata]